MNDFVKSQNSQIEKEFEKLGFKKKVILKKDMTMLISFHVGLNSVISKGRPYLGINPVIGVSYSSVQTIFKLLFNLKKDSHAGSTISSPLGYLMPKNEYKVWEFASDINCNKVLANLMDTYHKYGLPWQEKMSNALILRDTFIANEYAMIMDRNYKFPILLMILNDQEELEKFIAERISFFMERKHDAEMKRFQQFITNLKDLHIKSPELFYLG